MKCTIENWWEEGWELYDADGNCIHKGFKTKEDARIWASLNNVDIVISHIEEK